MFENKQNITFFELTETQNNDKNEINKHKRISFVKKGKGERKYGKFKQKKVR